MFKNSIKMHLIEAQFDDFDEFKQFAVGWDLDFKLLSKNNFNAYLNIYSNETFQLGRTRLRGTIHQNGLVPKGFRTIVFPATKQVRYNWLHKDVNSEQLLIFPRNGILESVSFDNFDVYVVSISERRLHQLICSYGFSQVEHIFSKSEKYLNLEASFLQDFWKDAIMLLEYSRKQKFDESLQSELIERTMIDQLLFKILKYLDQTREDLKTPGLRKRDIALKRSIGFITENENRLLSVKELCKVSQVSERTLEYAFLEKYQVSPSSYIKSHHLNLVKKELVKLKGRKKRVSDIAIKYGFHHMGQFSADFKKQFGLSPSKIK